MKKFFLVMAMMPGFAAAQNCDSSGTRNFHELDETAELAFYRFINDNSPVHGGMYPDAGMIGQPRLDPVLASTRPAIVIMPECVLQAEQETEQKGIDAFYDSLTQTIHVSDRIDLDSVYGQSLLLHEFVHHVQFQMDLDGMACPYSFIEADAYSLQAAYMKAQGVREDNETFRSLKTAGAFHTAVGERCLLELIMNGELPRKEECRTCTQGEGSS